MKHTRAFLTVPAAIIVAGALVAIALLWVNKPGSSESTRTAVSTKSAQPAQTGVPAVTAEDHILGNPNAPIKLIEYSDLSCPFCQEFNPILSRVMDTYGPGGKVAWIYRHFPLMKPIDAAGTIPHPNSGTQAEALECVAQLGGNSAFFAFEKKWFQAFPANGAGRSTDKDRAEIDRLMRTTNVDPVSFAECMASGRFRAKVDASFISGLKAGVTGTPTTIVITPSGTKIPLVGIQSYATLKNTIDTLITTIVSTTTSIKN